MSRKVIMIINSHWILQIVSRWQLLTYFTATERLTFRNLF